VLGVRGRRRAERRAVQKPFDVFHPVTLSAPLRAANTYRVGIVGFVATVTSREHLPRWGFRLTGHVIATDIDTGHLTGPITPHLTVLRHDITRDPRPDAAPFDLIHARFVLEHLPEREEVLDRLVTWLKPGGLIVIESIAGFPVDSSPHPQFREAMRAIDQVLAKTIGTDSTWARGFPGPLSHRDLVEAATAVHLPTTGGANASALCWALTLSRLRPRIREPQLTSDDTLDEALRLLSDPAFFDLAFATAITWARRPA
jgi:hypothetical protein